MIDYYGFSSSNNFQNLDNDKLWIEWANNNLKKFFGGVEGNFAVNISKLGTKSTFIGCTNWQEESFEINLEKNDVVSRMQKGDGKNPYTIVIENYKGRKFKKHSFGASEELKFNYDIKNAIRSHDSLYISFYDLLGQMYNTTIDSLLYAKKYELKILINFGGVLNFNKDEMNRLLDKYCDVGFGNYIEGSYISDEENRYDIIKKIGESMNTMVLTLGEKGSLINNRNDLFYFKNEKFINGLHIGAGDAYAAGFVHSILNGNDIETSGHFASLIAKIKILKNSTRI